MQSSVTTSRGKEKGEVVYQLAVIKVKECCFYQGAQLQQRAGSTAKAPGIVCHTKGADNS